MAVSRTTLTINLCHVLQVNFSQSSIRVTNLGTPPALGLSFSLLPSIISSENIDTNIHKQQLIILANNHIKMIRGMKVTCAFVVVAMMLLNSSYGFVVQPHMDHTRAAAKKFTRIELSSQSAEPKKSNNILGRIVNA